MGRNNAYRRTEGAFRCPDAITRRFVTALLEGANRTEAYRRTGGKAKGDGVRSKANQLVTNSRVQACLQSVQPETVNEAIMTYTEALERLTLMGRTTIHDIAMFGNDQIGEDEEGQPVFQAS